VVNGIIGAGHIASNVVFKGNPQSMARFDLEHPNVEMKHGIIMSTGFPLDNENGPIRCVFSSEICG
jgi:hypothetical protein